MANAENHDRVAIVYDCLFPFTTGGGERVYESFARHLNAKGMRADYLTSTQWEGDPPDVDGYTVVPVCGRLRLYDGDGVRRTRAALTFAWSVLRALLKRRRAYGMVIVGALPVLNVFAVRAALLGTGTKVVADYLEVWGARQWIQYAGRVTGTLAWALQRLALAVTPVATCHSRLTAERMLQEGFHGQLLLSPGLIESASAHDLSPAAANPPYVLYAGRHIPDKRVENLPAAVAIARRTIPDLRVVILGSGPSSPDVNAAIAAAEAKNWSDLPGFVSEAELDRLMAGASALVNPSRREGYGLVVVEASAHGTPVVLVQDPDNAATELIEPGVNGFIAPSAEPEDLAAAIVSAVGGGARLRHSTRTWYESAIQTRTIARTVDNIIAATRPDVSASSSGTSQNASPEGSL